MSEPQKANETTSTIVLNVDGHQFEKDKVKITVKDQADKNIKLKKVAGDTPSDELEYDLSDGNLAATFFAVEGSRADGDLASGKLTITITPKR